MQAIWHESLSPEQLQQWGRETMMEFLEIRMEEVGADFLVASMPVSSRTKQPMGLLHGGASAALAETVASIGANLLLDRSQQYAVGVALDVNHLRSVKAGRVRATAKPLQRGRSLQVWQIDVHDDNDRLAAAARLTCAVRNNPSE